MRADHAVIKDITKMYDRDIASTIQGLPFFLLDTTERPEYIDEHGALIDGYNVSITSLDIDKIMPFPRLVFFDQAGSFMLTQYMGDNEWVMTMVMDKSMVEILKIPEGLLINHSIAFSETDDPLKTKAKISVFITEPKTFEVPIPVIKLFSSNEYQNEMANILLNSLRLMLAYFIWAETRHLIEVTPNSAKQNGRRKRHGDKKPWTRNNLPQYIYLDAPHTPPKSGTTGTGASKRGHNRRAHWRTLKADKFKDHPMFGKPMRIKSTWVGPTEWENNGSTYKVK